MAIDPAFAAAFDDLLRRRGLNVPQGPSGGSGAPFVQNPNSPTPKLNTSVLDALSASNAADPRSVAGGINDMAQPFLGKLGGLGRGISKGVDFLERVGDHFRGAAERGVLGGIAPRFQAGVNAAQERALREMQIQGMNDFRIGGGQSPAAVREYEFFKNLPPEAQQEYLKVKRAYGVDRVYGVGNVDNQGNVVTTESDVVDAKANEQYQTTASAEQAKTEAIPTRDQTQAASDAAIQLSDYAIDFQRRKDRIMQLRNHPGMPDRVGLKSASSFFGLRDNALPNTRGAGFDALLEEVQGGVFSEAYETLKGGGQITEIESRKAEQAMTRIANLRQSEEDWLKAVDDFIEAMDDGYRKLEKAAAGDFSVDSGPVRIRYDSQGNRID